MQILPPSAELRGGAQRVDNLKERAGEASGAIRKWKKDIGGGWGLRGEGWCDTDFPRLLRPAHTVSTRRTLLLYTKSPELPRAIFLI